MSAPTTGILALLDPGSPDTWPQGILAAADLREQRAKAATPGPWELFCPGSEGFDVREQASTDYRLRARTIAKIRHGDFETCRADAEHIIREANPTHALAAVRRWRGVVERHRISVEGPEPWCLVDAAAWPCPDLTETAGEARAYLGGAA